MIGENETILRRWIGEVWNKGKLETIDELFDERGVAICPINPREHPLHGVDAFKDFFLQIGELFADIFMSIEECSENGEKVVALCTFRANRIFKDSFENIVRKPVELSGLCQIKVADGKIYEAWSNFDLLKAGL